MLVAWVIGVLVFLFLPIATIVLFAFDRSKVQSWPIRSFTTHWFSVAWRDEAVRSALWLSVKAGLAATLLALLLGSAAAFGVHRFRFFGREAVSLFLVLPIALPGIITGLALRSFFTFGGINLSLTTIIIGHTTFCIVVVYNNVLARLRRTSGSLGRGLHGSRRPRSSDLPIRDSADDRHRPRLRGPARLRSFLRRGHRHHLHGRGADDPAHLDLRSHPARPAAARGERRRDGGARS